MSSQYTAAGVYGLRYTGGNVVFSPDGTALYSAVRHHVCKMDMKSSRSRSMACSNSSIQALDVSVDGGLLLAIGSRGLGFYYSLDAQVVLDTISLPPSCTVHCVRLSADQRHAAVAVESSLQIWTTPAQRVVRFHACQRILNVHNALTMPIRCIEWTADGENVLVSGDDARILITSLNIRHRKGLVRSDNYLVGHRSPVMGAFFVTDERVVSVSRDNVVMLWRRTTVTRKEAVRFIAQKKMDGLQHLDDNDDDALPATVIESSKITARQQQGVSVSDADDTHLPDVLRYYFERHGKHMLTHKGSACTAAFCPRAALLAIGYHSGLFAIHHAADDALPLLHLLSVSSQALTALAFSPDGAVLAVGSEHLRQLIVWNWRDEQYVLREQSHYYDVRASAFTADGESLISGGDDGKVKVWHRRTGQCHATFNEHTAPIVGIAVSGAANAFFTASIDGTVRAFDMMRFRNFRIYTPPSPTPLTCVAVDPAAELLAVGAQLHARVMLFAVQTGKLVDELSGHEGSVTCLAFHPSGSALTSGAMDTSLMTWNLFGNRGSEKERLDGRGIAMNLVDVLSVSYTPTGLRLAALCRSGEVSVFDTSVPHDPQLLFSFHTRRDAAGGWTRDGIGPNSANADAHFTVIAYSPDGATLLAGGESKWIAMFHASQGFMLKRWPVTTNMDVSGAEEQFPWRTHTEVGNVDDIDVSEDDPHLRQRRLLELPGSTHRHFATGKRKTILTVRTTQVAFSYDGRDFVAATTDGVAVFSLDAGRPQFSPAQLPADLTPEVVRSFIADGHTLRAVVGALALNDAPLGREAMRRCPPAAIAVVASAVPVNFFGTLALWVSEDVETSPFVQHALRWARELLLARGSGVAMKMESFVDDGPAIRRLQKALASQRPLRDAVRDNTFGLKYLQLACGHPDVVKAEPPPS